MSSTSLRSLTESCGFVESVRHVAFDYRYGLHECVGKDFSTLQRTSGESNLQSASGEANFIHKENVSVSCFYLKR